MQEKFSPFSPANLWANPAVIQVGDRIQVYISLTMGAI